MSTTYIKGLPGLASLIACNICSSSRQRALNPERGWLQRHMAACNTQQITLQGNAAETIWKQEITSHHSFYISHVQWDSASRWTCRIAIGIFHNTKILRIFRNRYTYTHTHTQQNKGALYCSALKSSVRLTCTIPCYISVWLSSCYPHRTVLGTLQEKFSCCQHNPTGAQVEARFLRKTTTWLWQHFPNICI